VSCYAPFSAKDERNVTVERTADPSTALRFGRDDKGEGDASMKSGCELG
jgi:hypothetical protein